jgi:hypothetical protein
VRFRGSNGPSNESSRAHASRGQLRILSFAALTIVFLASRLAYIYAGVRFDWDPLRSSLAILDPELLRFDLLRSLLYLHSQPPLFNLFVGIVLKCAPGNPEPVFRILYLGMGLAMTFALQEALSRLNVPLWLGLVLTAAVMVSPAAVLYENLLFYTYPVTLMLILSVLCLEAHLRTGWMKYAWLFFGLLGCIVLTRSLFHPLWFVFVAGALIAIQRQHRRRLLVAAAVPLLLIAIWSVKNLALFGSANSSSWLGMSLCKMVTVGVPLGERVRLAEEGVLSPYALRPPYMEINKYRDLLARRDSMGVPVLDDEIRSTGNPNLNQSAYVGISRHYFDDALVLARLHPGLYLRGVAHALFIYFRPASEYLAFFPNRPSVQCVDRAVNRFLLGQIRYERPGFEANEEAIDYAWQVQRTGIVIALLYGVVLLWSIVNLWTCLRLPSSITPHSAMFMYLFSSLLYVSVVGNMLEIGENCRFRFMVDPFFVVLLAMALTRALTRRKSPPITDIP